MLVRSPGRSAPGPPPAGADELWLASQRILARDAGAALIVAEHSGHAIPRDRPELVAYAIRAVHEAAGAGRAVRLDAEELSKAGGQNLDRTSAT